jgi:putative ABC transport system ATP-binding protein
MGDPIVRACDLTRRYGRGAAAVAALRGASLTVADGELVAVHGRSGSGKTTLLNLVCGLDRPDSGTVAIAGQELSDLGEDGLRSLRRTTIGYVVQDFALIPSLTAAQNVGLPLRLQRVASDEREHLVAGLLDRLGVASCARQLPDQLSGGQQQRVAIARALTAAPRLLLADEPTGQLDSGTGREVVQLLRDIVSERGVALLVCTHDRAVLDVADRALAIVDGRIT